MTSSRNRLCPSSLRNTSTRSFMLRRTEGHTNAHSMDITCSQKLRMWSSQTPGKMGIAERKQCSLLTIADIAEDACSGRLQSLLLGSMQCMLVVPARQRLSRPLECAWETENTFAAQTSQTFSASDLRGRPWLLTGHLALPPQATPKLPTSCVG